MTVWSYIRLMKFSVSRHFQIPITLSTVTYYFCKLIKFSITQLLQKQKEQHYHPSKFSFAFSSFLSTQTGKIKHVIINSNRLLTTKFKQRSFQIWDSESHSEPETHRLKYSVLCLRVVAVREVTKKEEENGYYFSKSMLHRKRQKATNAPLYDVTSLRCVTVALSASRSYIRHVYTKLVLRSILGPGVCL